MNEQDNNKLRGIDRLLEVVARLRSKDGCPWDREQTLTSLKSYLVEETHELLDAIEDGDPERHKEELGDLLLHILLQIQIRQEEGIFDFDSVCHALSDKLIQRHPHVFGGLRVSGTAEVLSNWEKIKAQERGKRRSLLEGLPRHLPALQKAQRVQERASRVEFDWPNVTGALAKLEEELSEVRQAINEGNSKNLNSELGDLLFSAVNVCRLCRVQAEEVLRQAVERFVRRFTRVESRVHEAGRDWQDHSLAEIDRYWEETKQEDQPGAED
ncbi:MAG: nucleoside triphosphate pyrophosphohydrolase [Kiritimatiellia bacterium]